MNRVHSERTRRLLFISNIFYKKQNVKQIEFLEKTHTFYSRVFILNVIGLEFSCIHIGIRVRFVAKKALRI